MAKVLEYLKARAGEASTWTAIAAAIAGGAALPSPYSWLAIGAGVIGALVPTSGRAK